MEDCSGRTKIDSFDVTDRNRNKKTIWNEIRLNFATSRLKASGKQRLHGTNSCVRAADLENDSPSGLHPCTKGRVSIPNLSVLSRAADLEGEMGMIQSPSGKMLCTGTTHLFS